MALIINKQWRYGLDTTYWSIEVSNVDYKTKTATCQLWGYLNEESKKLNNDEPMRAIEFVWQGADFTFEKATNAIPEFYNKIKQEESWEGSIDG